MSPTATTKAWTSAVRDSCLLRCVSPRSAECTPYAGSIFSSARHTGRIPVAIALSLLVAAFPGSQFIWLGLALAYAFPRTAVLLIPLALVCGPRIPLFVWGDETILFRTDYILVAGAALHMITTADRTPRETPLYVPMACFMAVSAASTLFAAISAPVASGLPLLYLAQQAELFLIFVCVYNYPPRSATGVYAWLIPVLVAAAYGITEWRYPLEPHFDGVYRTFERGYFDGQANHFGGLFAMAVCVGLPLATQPRWRSLGLAVTVICGTAILGTHSREALVALAAGLATLAWRAWPRWHMTLLAVSASGSLWVLWQYWDVAAAPNGSLYARFQMWDAALATLPGHPLLGIGTGTRSRALYDNQYVMALVENGMLGLTIFLWWLTALAAALRPSTERPAAPYRIAALAALAVVAVQGLAAISFLVTITAGMLYWWCGCALARTEDTP